MPVSGSRRFYDPGMQVELEPELERTVRQLAAAQKITVEELIARAVRDFCARRNIRLAHEPGT